MERMTIDLAELQAALEQDPAAAEAIFDVLFRAAANDRDEIPIEGSGHGDAS